MSIGRLSQQEKDLEILLLRHQLAILERKLDKPVKPNRAEKLTLAVLTARLRLVTRRPATGLRDVIRIVAPYVPAVKINIAFFERYYTPGLAVYYELIRQARELGLLVIGDVKRADIGHSTTQYAKAQLGGMERAEIAALNGSLSGFRLLHGAEVEIRADGSLDHPDGNTLE